MIFKIVKRRQSKKSYNTAVQYFKKKFVLLKFLGDFRNSVEDNWWNLTQASIFSNLEKELEVVVGIKN